MVIGRKTMSVILVLVGLAVAAYGGWQLRTFTWEDATGTLSACTTKQERDSDSGHTEWTYDCAVTWTAGGAQHTDEHLRIQSANEAETHYGDGSTIAVKVSGDDAESASVQWLSVVMLAGGALLVVIGLGRLFSRSNPRPAQSGPTTTTSTV